MNRKLLNVVAIASLILPIRIAAADSLNARPCRWTITRTYVRDPGRTMPDLSPAKDRGGVDPLDFGADARKPSSALTYGCVCRIGRCE